MKSALRWGGGRAFPLVEPKEVEWIAGLDWRALGWCRPALPEPLVYLGTPGPRRKAVVHLIDPASHACELIVKVPLTPGAKTAIEHEAETLLQLQREEFKAAPRLVVFDRLRYVSSQTVIRGSRCGMQLMRETAALLQSLMRSGETITLQEIATRFAAARHTCLNLAATEAAVVDRAVEEITDSCELPAARIHGDFAPWNIKLQADGSAALIDWEESQPRGLPLQDGFHFGHITRYLFGLRPKPLFAHLPLRSPRSVGLSLRRKLEIAYLLQTLFLQLSRGNQKHSQFLLTTLRMTISARS